MLGVLVGVWIGYLYLLWRWGRWFPLAIGSAPEVRERVAVLIPARNEAHTLPMCLKSLLAQQRPPDEIWVIDDHSEDDTLIVAQGYAARFPQVHVLRLPDSLAGKKAALRYGLQHATAALIVTTDADTLHEPQTLAQLLAPFANPTVQATAGWIRLQAPSTLLGALQQIELGGVLQLTAGSWSRGEPLTANGALLAYRKSAFEAVQGWGPAQEHPSGDDDILVQRIRLHFGRKALVFTEAVAETPAAPTWKAFFAQRLRWLSKRNLYPAPWTPIGLAIVALAQISLPFAVGFWPAVGIPAWLLLALVQIRLVYRSFRTSRSTPPPLWAWGAVALLYPLYQLFLTPLALLRLPFHWKGRRYPT